MSKYNNINLYDVMFCLQDDDGNMLENKNGKPKLFRYKGDIYIVLLIIYNQLQKILR
jgi:hypothetical protein